MNIYRRYIYEHTDNPLTLDQALLSMGSRHTARVACEGKESNNVYAFGNLNYTALFCKIHLKIILWSMSIPNLYTERRVDISEYCPKY